MRFYLRLTDLTALAVLTWRIARQLIGDRFGPLAMLNAWSDWLETAGMAAGGVSLMQRGHRRAGLATLLGALFRGWYATQWRIPNHDPDGPTDVRIFTLNLLHHHDSGDDFARQIQREQPDVVLLQELTPRVTRDLLARLGDDYPYRLLEAVDGYAGFGILSRRPLKDGEILRWPGNRFAQVATLTISGRQVDLYNCHLMPPLGKRFRLLGPTRVTRLREAQVRLLTARIQEIGRPAILAGDFNLTPSQHAYDLLTAVLVDAWPEAGRGPGVTWPRNLDVLKFPGDIVPLLRIDYCFHTSDVMATRARVIYTRTGSDHCPLVVDLALVEHQLPGPAERQPLAVASRATPPTGAGDPPASGAP